MPIFVEIPAEMADLGAFFEICMAPYESDIYKDCPKKSTSGVGILTPSHIMAPPNFNQNQSAYHSGAVCITS